MELTKKVANERSISLTEVECSVLLQVINQATWKGDGVEICTELKKKLKPLVSTPKTETV